MRYLSLFLLVFLPFGNAFSKGLTLSAPSESNNGTYLLRLHDGDGVATKKSRLEVFRNFDGGEYRLILSVPIFKSLSQLVTKDGVYGYKVRVEGDTDFSEPVFVTVSTSEGGLFGKTSEVEVGYH